MAEDAPAWLAEYVRTRRLRAGLTQDALAERAGLTVDTVGALERGLRRRLYPHTARAIADALALSEAERAELTELAHGSSRAAGARPAVAAVGDAQGTTAPLHNLPVPLTRLIGREREMAQIQARLTQTRLLTLTGTGGVGKTRLSLEAAHALLPRYSEGVWLVDLAPLADPRLVLGAVAAVLGVREATGQSLPDTLAAALLGRRLLLLLDNFEQVLEAAPEIAVLLGACPNLSVLATSRSALGLYGEQELLVPPLLAPAESRSEAAEMVAQYAAVQLFIERAAAVKAGFALAPHNAAAVAAICARLDGLPLAIELAAARVKLFQPGELLTRLDQRLPLLTGGPHDRPARQRTLRAAIAWSYDLLSAPEQAFFRQLGVFVGGFTLSAAEAVCTEGASTAVDLIDLLGALVDRSLLQRDESGVATLDLSRPAAGAGGAGLELDEPEPRFSMFETLREFALEQLAIRGGERVHERHLAYCLDLMERAESDLQETVPVLTVWRTRRRLVPEYANLQAALAWAITHARGEEALRLSASLCALWVPAYNLRVSRQWLDQPAGTLSEAQRSLERSLALAVDDPLSPTLQAARARAFHALGRILVSGWEAGDDQRTAATRAFEQALALYRGLRDRQGLAACLFWLGAALFDQEAFNQAREAFEESLELSRALGAPAAIGWSLLGLGRVALMEGDSELAGRLLEESLERQQQAGNQLGVAGAHDALGLVGVAQRDYAGAIRHHEQALEVRRSLGAQSGIARSLYQLAVLLGTAREVPRALTLLRESLILGQRMQNPWDIMVALLSLGGMIGTTGSPALGARLIGAGQELERAKGLQVPVTYQGIFERTLAFLQRQLGDEAFAAHWQAGRALSLDEAIAEAMEVAEQG